MVELNQNSKYSIMLSGGLDSAILLYVILKEAQVKNIKLNLQPFSIPKHDGSHLFVKTILEYFKEKFEVTIADTILVGNPNVHHSQQSKTAVAEILQKYPGIDFIYFATNQNPIKDFDYAPYPEGSFPNRVKESGHPKVLMPFIHMYKDEILKILFDHGQEELLKLTHSCTEQKTGRCGRCFQCNERAWAFRQLDKLDSGIN
jgi:hypothetical protein